MYPSWTAFVFLLLGCILWLFPDSRRASLCVSPLIVLYAVSLTVLQVSLMPLPIQGSRLLISSNF